MSRTPGPLGSSCASAGSPGSLSTPAPIRSAGAGRGPTTRQAVCFFSRGERTSRPVHLVDSKCGSHACYAPGPLLGTGVQR